MSSSENQIAEALSAIAYQLRRLGLGDACANGLGALEGHTMETTKAMESAARIIADGIREGLCEAAEILAEAIEKRPL